jgi:hypothetical protein
MVDVIDGILFLVVFPFAGLLFARGGHFRTRVVSRARRIRVVFLGRVLGGGTTLRAIPVRVRRFLGL